MSDALLVWLRKLFRRRYASGGIVYHRAQDDDRMPALLSSGCQTYLRPGETHVEAMERLMEGEDL